MNPPVRIGAALSLLSIALLPAVPLHAQTPARQIPPPVPVVTPDAAPEPEITVDELVSRALAGNPQIPIARQTQEAARERRNALRGLTNPLLQVVPGIGNREARDEEIILSQPLDVFGQRRAQRRVAEAQLRLAGSQVTLAERTLVVQVRNAAADLFAAQEAESLGTVQVEVAELFRNAAARRAQLGDVPQVQVQRADLEVLRTRNDLTNARAERLARRAAINLLISQPPQTPLRVSLPISTGLTDLLRVRPGSFRAGTPGGVPSVAPDAGLNPPAASSGVGAGTTNPTAPVTGGPLVGSSSQVGSNLLELRASTLAGALTNRPDVVGAQATLEARRAQVDVLRRQRFPSIELQARRASVTGSSGTALRAVVVLPFFDFGSNRGERRALQAEVRAQEATITFLQSQIGAQVEQALIRLQQQRETVERYRSGIVPTSVDLLRKTQIGYTQGASTALEVLEAQRTLRQVQTEYLQALVGVRTQEASLEGALGTDLPAGLTGTPINPSAPAAPPGTAAPGTVPEGTIPPNTVAPLNPPSGNLPPTGAGVGTGTNPNSNPAVSPAGGR